MLKVDIFTSPPFTRDYIQAGCNQQPNARSFLSIIVPTNYAPDKAEGWYRQKTISVKYTPEATKNKVKVADIQIIVCNFAAIWAKVPTSQNNSHKV